MLSGAYSLEGIAAQCGNERHQSRSRFPGKQELLENIVNRYV